jgi:hypothetical protein
MADPTPRASTLKSGSVDLVESLDPAAAARALPVMSRRPLHARGLSVSLQTRRAVGLLAAVDGRERVRETSARPGRLCHAVRDAGPGASADFRFAINGEPTFFSPSSSDPPTAWVNRLIYTGLYRANPPAPRSTLRVSSGRATGSRS